MSVLTALTLVAVGTMTATGHVSAAAAAGVASAAPLWAVLLTGCAVAVATGPRPDARWLYAGDTGVALLVAHYTQGVHLAVAAAGLPAAAAWAAITTGAPIAAVAAAALLWTVSAAVSLGLWSRRRLRAFH